MGCQVGIGFIDTCQRREKKGYAYRTRQTSVALKFDAITGPLKGIFLREVWKRGVYLPY